MPTDQQISILVDVARLGGADLPPQRLNGLLDLAAQGYVRAKPGSGDRYELTAKGQAALDERGVGANES